MNVVLHQARSILSILIFCDGKNGEDYTQNHLIYLISANGDTEFDNCFSTRSNAAPVSNLWKRISNQIQLKSKIRIFHRFICLIHYYAKNIIIFVKFFRCMRESTLERWAHDTWDFIFDFMTLLFQRPYHCTFCTYRATDGPNLGKHVKQRHKNELLLQHAVLRSVNIS